MLNNQPSEITTWLDTAGRFPVLPSSKIDIIAREIQALPENSRKRKKLVNKIVNHNLRLVARFTKLFMTNKSHNKWGSPETADYLQVGTMGLIRAAEKFDPSRGYRFSTYANFWIRHAIGRYNLKTMSIVHVSEFASRQVIFYRRHGYLNNKYTGSFVEKTKAEMMVRQASAAYSCVSLDKPCDDYGTTLSEYIEDPNSVNVVTDDLSPLRDSLEEAGVNWIGREILIENLVNDKSLDKISRDLGMKIGRIKAEKRMAISAVKKRPDAFSDWYNVSATSPVEGTDGFDLYCWQSSGQGGDTSCDHQGIQ